jgi:hypothetical protein
MNPIIIAIENATINITALGLSNNIISFANTEDNEYMKKKAIATAKKDKLESNRFFSISA